MENKYTVENLHVQYSDVSQKLSAELVKYFPDTSILKDYRKQLSQLDKDIRRIQIQRDWN